MSALPPPVTRGLYRSHWFVFLNAHLEDDARAADAALGEIEKAARTVSVKRLSDFARTAVHEGRLAEKLGKPDRALRAYDAALRLDETSYDAVASKIEFLARRREYLEAVKIVPLAVAALFATREPRLAAFSSLGLCVGISVSLALLGSILILALRCLPRVAHDAREVARRMAGESGAVPLLLIVLLLPAAFGLGPVWWLLWWGVLFHAYASGVERRVLLVGMVLFGFVMPVIATIARENILQRSPLYVAALDLDERREDASAEDGLRQASAVFPEDPDVWFLLGIYAERAGDNDRALQNYDRAIAASPKDYRPYLNRGNVHFQEGDFGQATSDYGSAAERAPGAPEVFYNLAIARGESYDFDGQTAAIAKARVLSPRSVDSWARNPTYARVVSASYGLGRARRRVEEWNAQPKSMRLPGHAPPMQVWTPFLSPSRSVPGWRRCWPSVSRRSGRRGRWLRSACGAQRPFARCAGGPEIRRCIARTACASTSRRSPSASKRTWPRPRRSGGACAGGTGSAGWARSFCPARTTRSTRSRSAGPCACSPSRSPSPSSLPARPISALGSSRPKATGAARLSPEGWRRS